MEKGTYELLDYDGIPLSQPRNKLYLKRYYAWLILVKLTVYILSLHVCVCVF